MGLIFFGDTSLGCLFFHMAAMQRSAGGTTFGRYIKLMHT